MSRLLVCSSPDTESAVLPGATAVTTPVSDTRATFGSADAHCIVRGLTIRPPCPGTTTWRVSTSLGPSVTGLGSWIAMSLCCTTTGGVGRSRRRLRLRARLRARGRSADHLYGRLTPARSHPSLDDRHAPGHAGHGAVVVDLGHGHVVRGPGESHRRDHVAPAIERGG